MVITGDRCNIKFITNKIIALIMCFDKHNLDNNILEFIYNTMIYLSVQNKTFLTGFPNNLTISTLNDILCNGGYNHNWKMRLLFDRSDRPKYCHFNGKEPQPYIRIDTDKDEYFYKRVLKDFIINYNIIVEIIDISTIHLHINYELKNDIKYLKSHIIKLTGNGTYQLTGIIKSGTKVSNTIVIRQDCKNCCI